jgi:2-keto-4-pentenoate hydratase
MLSDRERAAACAALEEAERTCRPIPPLRDAYPGMGLDDAYAIQQLGIAQRVAGGARVVGHKVGLSSRAMQLMMGVDEPDFGHLTDAMSVLEDADVDVAALCQPRVEIESAFVLGAPLAGPGVSVADVVRATDFVLPSIEIIDSRITGWDIRLVDTVADNASSARVVLGGTPRRLTELDLRSVPAALERNGRVVETGTTGAVLGNPVTAVAWLANTLGRFGVTLEAGHVILPGSCTRAVDVAPGDWIRARFGGLGEVAVGFV